MSHVFISYNHEDEDFAEILSQKLQSSGFATWRDVDMLRAGEVWRVEIDQAIKDSFAMIVVMTPKAKISEYVTYEWAFAFGVGVKIIPIMLKSTNLHPRLEDIQYLDFTGRVRPWKELIDTAQKVAKSNKSNKRPIPIYIQQAITGLNSLKATDREEAIQSLAESDHLAAREALIEGLEHPRKEMRIQIGLLLAEYKEPKAIPILIDTLHNQGDDIRNKAIAALVKVGFPAVLDLCKVLNDNDRKARLAAVKALGEIGDITTAQDLLKMLHDMDEDVQVNAVEAIGKIKDNAALQTLSDLLGDTKSGTNLRNAVIFALGSIGDTNAIPEIGKCLLNDENEFIRMIAAVALGNFKNVAALSVLQEALQDTAYEVRLAAANGLGKIRDVSAIPALQEALHDSHHQVRENIAFALGEIGGPSAVPVLIEALQDTDIAVIDTTLGALRRIGTSEALKAIQDWRNLKRIE
jgi:HEAT repeat protein